jgi:REP element-mobilizing transposase RayT
MAQSLAKLYVHVIFSTKNRAPWLTPALRAKLFPYLAGVLQEMHCPPIEIGGVADHVHGLCAQDKGIALVDMIKEMKTATSAWIKKQENQGPELLVMAPSLKDFHWQSGYGAFSVSASNVQKVRSYILGQEEHHRQESFQEEFIRFLEKYQVEYHAQYVWD